MAKFKEPDRNQLLMLETIDLSKVVRTGSPVHIIDHMIDRLDTTELEIKYKTESPKGQPAFHPKTMLKIGLLAINNCRFSTRNMEEDTRYNLTYKYITGNKVIDHSTFGKFFSKFHKEIASLFSKVVLICQEEDLIDFKILAIDTVKIKANASYKNSMNLSGLRKKQEKLRKKIEELLINTEQADEKQIEVLNKKIDKIKRAETILSRIVEEEIKEKTEKEKLEIEKSKKINTTDTNASIMCQANGEKNVMYAVTAGVDTKNDIITGFEVSGTANDPEMLFPVIEKSSENTGKPHEACVSDSGFVSLDNMEKAEENDVDLYAPDKRKEAEDMNNTKKGEYDKSKFEYNQNTDTYKCPEGKELNNIQQITGSDGRLKKVYANPIECRNCPNRSQCTKSKQNFRKITRDANEEIKERMRVKLNSEEGKEIYKKRSHAAESPFGNLKENKKFKEFMRRGIDKIRMECALIFMLHNIKKTCMYCSEG